MIEKTLIDQIKYLISFYLKVPNVRAVKNLECNLLDIRVQ